MRNWLVTLAGNYNVAPTEDDRMLAGTKHHGVCFNFKTAQCVNFVSAVREAEVVGNWRTIYYANIALDKIGNDALLSAR